MKTRYLSGLICPFFLFSCSSLSVEEEPISFDEIAKIFDQQVECESVLIDIIYEWESNGGFVDKSILKTRMKILKDNKSNFAKIIKNSWKNQKKSGFSDKENSFGEWPVIEDNIIRMQSDLPDNIYPYTCGPIISYMPNILWVHVIKKYVDSGVRIDEAPPSLHWSNESSYELGFWLYYWLFVNVE